MHAPSRTFRHQSFAISFAVPLFSSDVGRGKKREEAHGKIFIPQRG